MREGWICSRCQASVSPDETTCPLCSSVQRQQITVTAPAPDIKFPIPKPIKLCGCTSPSCLICHPNVWRTLYEPSQTVSISARPIQGIN